MLRLQVRRADHVPPDGKVWRVLAEGYMFPLAAFYEWHAAVRYAHKTCQLHNERRFPHSRARAS